MPLNDVERGILFLYANLPPPRDIDEDQLAQFLTPDELAEVLDNSFENALSDLTSALELGTRRDRFAGVLAYVLALRCDPTDNGFEPDLATLGASLVAHFPSISGPETREDSLRTAVGRLSDEGVAESGMLDALEDAFAPVLTAVDNGDGTYALSGDAAEMAMMFIEVATLEQHCTTHVGTVEVNGQPVTVTLLIGETCSNVAFERATGGVDPRNWPAYNPALFRRVDVVLGNPTATGSWAGIVQERVGALSSLAPIVTNLSVTYTEMPGLAVTTYDLAPASITNIPADDGKVIVDHGMVAVYEEQGHVRFRCVKVVAFAPGGPALPPTTWICPLWLQQILLSGWWSWL